MGPNDQCLKDRAQSKVSMAIGSPNVSILFDEYPNACFNIITISLTIIEFWSKYC